MGPVIRTLSIAFAVVALLLQGILTTQPAMGAEGDKPVINFLSTPKRYINFSYDYEAREVDMYQRFKVLWDAPVEIYLKVMATNNVLIDPNADPERGVGWYVSIYILDAEGNDLQKDAKGNDIVPLLGVRHNNTPTKGVYIYPDTVYTILLRIHVPRQLVENEIYTGAVVLAIKSTSYTTPEGSGGTMDVSEVIEARMVPIHDYYINGVVYYKNEATFASNATVVLFNKDTEERLVINCNDYGYYSVNLDAFIYGWHNGDTIAITAEYMNLRETKEVKVDITRGGRTVDFLLKPHEEAGIGWNLMAPFILFVVLAMALVIYRSKQKIKKRNKAKTFKGTNIRQGRL